MYESKVNTQRSNTHHPDIKYALFFWQQQKWFVFDEIYKLKCTMYITYVSGHAEFKSKGIF